MVWKTQKLICLLLMKPWTNKESLQFLFLQKTYQIPKNYITTIYQLNFPSPSRLSHPNIPLPNHSFLIHNPVNLPLQTPSLPLYPFQIETSLNPNPVNLPRQILPLPPYPSQKYYLPLLNRPIHITTTNLPHPIPILPPYPLQKHYPLSSPIPPNPTNPLYVAPIKLLAVLYL